MSNWFNERKYGFVEGSFEYNNKLSCSMKDGDHHNKSAMRGSSLPRLCASLLHDTKEQLCPYFIPRFHI